MRQVFTIKNLLFILTLSLSHAAIGQSSTINTELMATSGYTSNTSAGSGGTAYITFAIENNSGSDIKLTDVGRYVTTAYNGETSTLYYSSTSLSGSPGTLPAAGWTKVDENVLSGIGSSAINPVNVGMSFIIPNGAIYRFALMTTGTNTYSSSGAPNTFTVAGVSLYCGDYQINGSNVGYGASNSPRYFRGSITFEPACDAKVTTDPAKQAVCGGDDATFTVAATDAQSYRWQFNNNGVWTDLTDNATYSGTGTTNLTVRNVTLAMQGFEYRALAINTASSCSAPSAAASLDILGAGFSSVGINASSGTSLCKGQEVAISSYFTNGGINPKFEWLKNGAVIPGEDGGVLKISNLADNDVIAVRFTSSATCVKPTTSAPIQFNVENKLVPSVGIAVSYNGDDSYTFSAIPKNEGDAPKYYWFINDIAVPGENGPTFTKQGLQPYERVKVMMSSNLPCADPLVATSRNASTGVGNLDDNSASLNIIPNPNAGNFTITLARQGIVNKEVNIKVFNAMGQLVHTQNAVASSDKLSIPVAMPEMPGGMYILNIAAGTENESMRFMINK